LWILREGSANTPRREPRALHEYLWLLQSQPDIFKEDGQAKCSDIEKCPFDIISNKIGYSGQIFLAYVWGISFFDELNLIGSFN
jgi:hypothetical protein